MNGRIHKTLLWFIPPMLQWLTQGVTIISPFMAILSLCLNAAELMILKNQPTPSYPEIFMVFLGIAGSLVWLGYAWEHYGFWEATMDRSNKRQNPGYRKQMDIMIKLAKKNGIEVEEE
jgi:amino acid permease